MLLVISLLSTSSCWWFHMSMDVVVIVIKCYVGSAIHLIVFLLSYSLVDIVLWLWFIKWWQTCVTFCFTQALCLICRRFGSVYYCWYSWECCYIYCGLEFCPGFFIELRFFTHPSLWNVIEMHVLISFAVNNVWAMYFIVLCCVHSGSCQ